MAEDTPEEHTEPLDLPGGESTPHQPHIQKPRNRKKLFIIGGAVLLLLLLGLASMKLFGKKPATTTQPSNQTASTQTPSLKVSDFKTTSDTKIFTGETLAVGFTYPTNWTLSEKEGTITVKSPDFNFETLNQGTVKGYFRLYIRKMARDVDGKYIGRAVAVMPTEKLTYSQPNPTQRKETNLSFFGYDDADNFAFMMITGNFNLKKGDTLGGSYGKEADTYIIVGGYSTDDDKDDLSFRQVAPDGFQATNAYKQAVEILKSLKVS